MSGFSGINQFGNLTLQNGQRLSFNDIKDVDGDGKISKEEFNAFLKENNVDTIELSLVDKNGDGEITEQEYAVLEQKQQMQEAINAMAKDISFDFAGTTLIPEVTAKLKELVANYENNYNGDISKMAEAFIRELPEKYEAIKNEVLANDPSTIKNGVINEMVENFGSEGLTNAATKTLSQQLESVANAFVQSYTGSNLEADLTAHLENWLTKTDSEKLADSVSDYQRRLDTLGSTIESGELPKLLYAAQELLTSALENGVTAKLGEQVVTATNINAVLNKYKDGEALKADLQAFIDGLSTVNKKEQIIADEAAKAEAAAEKAFTGIKGSEYQVNIDLIDVSKIISSNKSAAYSAKGLPIVIKIGDSEEVQANVRAQGRERAALMLNSESCKAQFREQIKSMLEAKGIDFSKVEDIFENAYRNSLWTAIDMDGSLQIECTGNSLMRICCATINLQKLISNFGKVFNERMASAINETNKSNTDMDITDIDYAATAGNDKAVKTNIEVARGTYFGSRSNAKAQLGNYINRLKTEMNNKAKSMCLANGIKFDSKSFNTIFNNAKLNAVEAAETENGYINLRSGMENFANKFKTSYTNWVEAEKAKGANK